jgi:hypothetical protein
MKPYGLPRRPVMVLEQSDYERMINRTAERMRAKVEIGRTVLAMEEAAEMNGLEIFDDLCPGCHKCPWPCDEVEE